MRTQTTIQFFGLLVSCTPVAAWHLYKRAAVVVTSPSSGSTVVAKSDFNIEWQHSTDNNVTISLRQGTAENMTLAHVIAGELNSLEHYYLSFDLHSFPSIPDQALMTCSKHTQQRQLRLALPRR
jgi:hypothetical protein